MGIPPSVPPVAHLDIIAYRGRADRLAAPAAGRGSRRAPPPPQSILPV